MNAKKTNDKESQPILTRIFSQNKRLLITIISVILIVVISCIIIFSSGLILTKKQAQSIMDDTVDQTINLIEDVNSFRAPLKKHLSIDVLGVKLSSEGYYANCLITSVDYSEVLIEYFSTLSADEVASVSEIIARLESVLEKAPVVKKEFTVKFSRDDDGYSPIFTEEIVNFCNGNTHAVQEYLIEFLDQENTK